MNRQRFEERNRAEWGEFEKLVDDLDKRQMPAEPERVPGLFRKICGDLSLAQHRMYGLDLSERLNHIVIRGYNHIYSGLGGGISSALRWSMVDFPAAVRSEWRLFWLCSVIFWVPFFALIASAYLNPEWIETILPPSQRYQLELGFGPDSKLSDFRDEFGSNFMMFGLYVMNNIGIDFRIFAGGIFAGLGTIFYLFYNGVYIGASAGFVHYIHGGKFPEPFYAFTSGHSSFELLGMVIAGVAGMRLGLAVLSPGRLTRGRAIAAAGKRVLPLICGAAMMTFVAAVIEGFWSATDAPSNVKYTVGLSFWALLAVYFLFCGRGAKLEPR